MGDLEDWQHLLDAERRIQAMVPGAVLVGGTAVALHLRHRLSLDGDHVLADLRDRFDQVLATLDANPAWRTERLQRPVLILGSFDRAMTGLRQLRRSRPLDTEVREGLRVPTLEELARIKSWMLVDRNTTRDYVDVVAIFEALGQDRVSQALTGFDSLYGTGPGGSPASIQLIERLRAGAPQDYARIDLADYKGIRAPWNDWSVVAAHGIGWAGRLAGWSLGA